MSPAAGEQAGQAKALGHEKAASGKAKAKTGKAKGVEKAKAGKAKGQATAADAKAKTDAAAEQGQATATEASAKGQATATEAKQKAEVKATGAQEKMHQVVPPPAPALRLRPRSSPLPSFRRTDDPAFRPGRRRLRPGSVFKGPRVASLRSSGPRAPGGGGLRRLPRPRPRQPPRSR